MKDAPQIIMATWLTLMFCGSLLQAWRWRNLPPIWIETPLWVARFVEYRATVPLFPTTLCIVSANMAVSEAWILWLGGFWG